MITIKPITIEARRWPVQGTERPMCAHVVIANGDKPQHGNTAMPF